MRVRVGILEVVADRMEAKFDAFAAQCTTSLSAMENKLGEIGQLVSRFVDTAHTAKDVPHDIGGNIEEPAIDLTKVCTLSVVLLKPSMSLVNVLPHLLLLTW